MFGYDNVQVVTVNIGDPGADRNILIWRAPKACEIINAYAVDNVGLEAGTANYFSIALQNAGTAGTATTALATALGGTPASGTAAAWTVNVPQKFTIVEGTLSAGQWVKAAYDETGTCAQNLSIALEVLYGVGA